MQYTFPEPSRASAGLDNEVEGASALHRKAGGGGPGSLVNRHISHRSNNRNPVPLIEIYPRGVRLFREYKGESMKRGLRGSISSFTPGSRRRLRWAASNASPALISQFGMTYHKETLDGWTIKRQLDAFLKALRRKHPGVGYLWILEFQSRGVAHFHLFLTLSHETENLQTFMAETWHRVTGEKDVWHLEFHRDRRQNFIEWEIGDGSYLCKYLDKLHQKAVPEGFKGVGRFWGTSRGLVPPPDVVEGDNGAMPADIIRTLCKHHEKSLRHSKWKSRARRSPCSFRLPNGAKIANRLLKEAKNESLRLSDYVERRNESGATLHSAEGGTNDLNGSLAHQEGVEFSDGPLPLSG